MHKFYLDIIEKDLQPGLEVGRKLLVESEDIPFQILRHNLIQFGLGNPISKMIFMIQFQSLN